MLNLLLLIAHRVHQLLGRGIERTRLRGHNHLDRSAVMIHANHLDVLDTDVGLELVDSVAIGSLAGGLDVREFRVGLFQGLDKWFEHRCVGLHIIRLGNNDEL